MGWIENFNVLANSILALHWIGIVIIMLMMIIDARVTTPYTFQELTSIHVGEGTGVYI